jgi:hypothetical protein
VVNKRHNIAGRKCLNALRPKCLTVGAERRLWRVVGGGVGHRYPETHWWPETRRNVVPDRRLQKGNETRGQQ